MISKEQQKIQELSESVRISVQNSGESPVDILAEVPSRIIPFYINLLFRSYQSGKMLAEISGLVKFVGDIVSFRAQNSDNYTSIYNSTSPYYVNVYVPKLVESTVKELILSRVVTYWIPNSIQSKGAKKMYARIIADSRFVTEVDPIFLIRGIRLNERS